MALADWAAGFGSSCAAFSVHRRSDDYVHDAAYRHAKAFSGHYLSGAFAYADTRVHTCIKPITLFPRGFWPAPCLWAFCASGDSVGGWARRSAQWYTDIAEEQFVVNFPIYSLEIYDPATNAWSTVEPDVDLGWLFSAVLLADGRLLFVGFGGIESGQEWQPSGVVNVLNLAKASWTQIPSPLFSPIVSDIVLLDDGRVMVSDALDFGEPTTRLPHGANEFGIFHPNSGNWQETPTTIEVFQKQVLFPLNGGRVMALGSIPEFAHAEVYDPAAHTWTVVSSLGPYDHQDYAIQLSDGGLLAWTAKSCVRSGHGRMDTCWQNGPKSAWRHTNRAF